MSKWRNDKKRKNDKVKEYQSERVMKWQFQSLLYLIGRLSLSKDWMMNQIAIWSITDNHFFDWHSACWIDLISDSGKALYFISVKFPIHDHFVAMLLLFHVEISAVYQRCLSAGGFLQSLTLNQLQLLSKKAYLQCRNIRHRIIVKRMKITLKKFYIFRLIPTDDLTLSKQTKHSSKHGCVRFKVQNHLKFGGTDACYESGRRERKSNKYAMEQARTSAIVSK